MSAQGPDQIRTARAAAVQADEARQDRNRKVGLGVMVVVILGAVVAAAVWTNNGSGSTLPVVHNAITARNWSVIVGNYSAPVKIAIYEDYLSSDCRQLEKSTRDLLRQKASDGIVQVTYYPVGAVTGTTYSARALRAWAAVLTHGTPEQALRLHDLLFDNQPFGTAADSTTQADIARLVARTGATGSAVTSALSASDPAFVSAALQRASSMNTKGGPDIFLNGKELPPASVTDLVTQIENAVHAAS